MDGDALVRDYLDRLEAATWPLAPARRSELRAEVAEHIDAALAEAGTRDEVTVRNVLERLGRPEEIAAADADPGTGASPTVPSTIASPWGPVEILAILFLTLGSAFLPFVGPPGRPRLHLGIAPMDDAREGDRQRDRPRAAGTAGARGPRSANAVVGGRT